MARPDLKELNTLLKSLAELDDALTSLMNGEETQRETVRNACTGIMLAYSKKALKSVPVEELSNSHAGIRVSLLKEAGYETLGDIEAAGEKELQAIDGIGEKQIEAIRNIIAEFHNRIVEHASVKLIPTDDSEENMALIAAIAAYLHGQEIRRDGSQLYSYVHEMAQSIFARELVRNRLQWLFAPKDRKRATSETLEELIEFYSDDLAVQAKNVISLYLEACGISPGQAMAYFRDDSASFYAAFEDIAGNRIQKPLIYSSIPAKLASEIDSMQLDLTGFKGTLRSYQAFGAKYILHQQRVLLGDEMGLGKTVQAIAAMSHIRSEKLSKAKFWASGASSDSAFRDEPYFLVVCPASVLINWCREITKFSDIPVHLIHGSGLEAELAAWRLNGGAAVTNYESMGRIVDRIDEIMDIDMLVIDEAHYIKNPDAKRTRYIRALDEESDRILLMTGTPLENRVSEMCALIDFIRPDMASKVRECVGLSAVPEFRKMLAPVYLRRLREHVLEELPPVEEQNEWCEMTDVDKIFYVRSVFERNFTAMRRVSFQQDDLSLSAKGMRLVELCEQVGDEGRKAIVYSFFRDTVARVAEMLGDRCVGMITGSTDVLLRQSIIDAFTEAPEGSVLVCQIQAGGTGLNIQAASVVFFCEPQIKPSLEHQALSRVYRMGQINNVLVYHLLCPDTADEAVLEILERKQEEFDSYAENSAMADATENIIDREWIQNYIDREMAKYQSDNSGNDAESL